MLTHTHKHTHRDEHTHTGTHIILNVYIERESLDGQSNRFRSSVNGISVYISISTLPVSQVVLTVFSMLMPSRESNRYFSMRRLESFRGAIDVYILSNPKHLDLKLRSGDRTFFVINQKILSIVILVSLIEKFGLKI